MMKGLYKKYNVTKADGSEIEPKARYFVLRYDTDPAARQALMVYAELVGKENPVLMQELAQSIAEVWPEPEGEQP